MVACTDPYPSIVIMYCTFPRTSSIFTPAILGFTQPPCTALLLYNKWTISAYRLLEGYSAMQFGLNLEPLKLLKSTFYNSCLKLLALFTPNFKEGMQSLWTTASLVLWSGHSTTESKVCTASVTLRKWERRRRRGGGFFIMKLNLTRRLHRSSVPRP